MGGPDAVMGTIVAAGWSRLPLGPGLEAGESLGDRWRDLALAMWIAAGVAAGVWFVVFGLLAAATNPRRVAPGSETLDLTGPEPPAVVNLITRDWQLGREAVPATLLDLAARRHLAIDQVGEQTLVRVPTRAPASAADLTSYESMVLDHVRRLAAHADGVIPAEALTTGPEQSAKGWWRRFQHAVRDDARDRDLSRARWSGWMRLTLTVLGLAVGVAVALALSTSLPDDDGDGSAGSSGSSSSRGGGSSSSESDDDPITGSLAGGVVAFGGLMALVSAISRERDTPAGRAAAARWLGLGEMLSSDVIFAEHPPAAVAIWDRHLAYGAGMGVAHGAVRALPLGAESDTEAWSPVGGRWRLVRVRYPDRIPPGYGRHPFKVALAGLVELALAGSLLRWLPDMPGVVEDTALDLGSEDLDLALVGRIADIVALVLAGLAGIVVLRAAVMFLLGAGDLVRGRHTVEGRVLRSRLQGQEDRRTRRIAVDDGTDDRIRAWRLPPALDAPQGATVRARVSRSLAHVRDFERVRDLAATEHLDPHELDDAGATTGSANPWGADERVFGGAAAAAPAGPPPALPDAADLGRIVELPLEPDPEVKAHPLALEGGSAGFTGPGGAQLQIAWMNPAAIAGFGHLPRFLYRTIDGLGDEAYRARFGGHVTARRGDHVALVIARLPGRTDDERDRVAAAAARCMLDLVPQVPHVPQVPPTPGEPQDL